MRLVIVNWPLIAALCATCYLVSMVTLTQTAANFGLFPKLTNALPWVTDAEDDWLFRRVRVAGVGLVSFLMGSYLLYQMLGLR
jgi:hypothetical protein